MRWTRWNPRCARRTVPPHTARVLRRLARGGSCGAMPVGHCFESKEQCKALAQGDLARNRRHP